uniref:PfkB domain-containing protein n=1 Tax=Strongyloides stercoralis TaxID=6248 RepID=A0A0K0EBJ1_STRER
MLRSPLSLINFNRNINKKINLPNFVKLSSEVRDGLINNRPIVALESTVITHGLPFPENIKLGKELENIVRQENCIPATISLINGKINIGTSEGDLEKLASLNNGAVKVSTRDIGNTIVSKKFGGTTVAATMFLSNLVGVKFFATGGIGGVHRHVEESFDISCDLIELGRTPVVVVCSGAKSILDIPKTLEFLETHGVNVIVNDDDCDFPGFFIPKTGLKGCYGESNLMKIAEIIKVNEEMGNKSGTLVSVPIPKEASVNGEEVERAIKRALDECREKNIGGKEVTPFILKRVRDLTEGISLTSNIALLKNNAKVASVLANKYFEILRNKDKSIVKCFDVKNEEVEETKQVTVIGASIIDIDAIVNMKIENNGASYPGNVYLKPGGVGRNHADALTKLGISTTLISAIGQDQFGIAMEDFCKHMDMSNVLRIPSLSTPVYLGITSQKNLFCGILNLGEILSQITPEFLKEKEDVISNSEYIIMDGNITEESIKKIAEIAQFYNKKLWYEPTDIFKVKKVFDKNKKIIKGINYFSPNKREFNEYCLLNNVKVNINSDRKEMISLIKQNHELLFNNDIKLCLITLDMDGVIIWDNIEKKVYEYDSPKNCNIISPSGAGDCFNSGFLASMINNKSISESLIIATNCAKQSMECEKAVPNNLKVLY